MHSSKAKESFLENYEPQTSRLSVFSDIHGLNKCDTHNEEEEVREVSMTVAEEDTVYGESQEGYLSSSEIASDAALRWGNFSPVKENLGNKPRSTKQRSSSSSTTASSSNSDTF